MLINTESQLESFLTNALYAPSAFMFTEGKMPWIAFSNEAGDWWALRPVHEDDAGNNHQRVLTPLEEVALPIEVRWHNG